MLAKYKVVNCSSLNVRSGPSMSSPPVQWLQAGDIVTIDDRTSGGWLRLQGTTRYAYEKYLQFVENLEPASQPAQTPSTPPPASVAGDNDYNKVTLNVSTLGVSKSVAVPLSSSTSNINGRVNIHGSNIQTNDIDELNSTRYKNNINRFSANYGAFYLYSSENFPKVKSVNDIQNVANWSMIHSQNAENHDSLLSMFNKIQKNMDIPSFYTREQLNWNVHVNFNRFKKEFPDTYLRNTIGVVIFTRPDLNLYDSSLNKNAMIASDPRSNHIINKNAMVARLLTNQCTGKESHKFNPLLSNLAQSLDVVDDSIDTLDTGETFTGYKMQYAKHNIKSITSGSISIKYRETYDLSITDTHQLWVDYMSNVYRGIFEPKREYVWKKELDYACDVYYFLLDQDGETIKFWTKYYGVFPNNVPKSAYSYDFGSSINLPELSVNYSYIYKEDLSPVALM